MKETTELCDHRIIDEIEHLVCVKKVGHTGWHNNRKGDFWYK